MNGPLPDRPPGPRAASQADGMLVPFDLELDPIRRLLVIDVADDPIYRGLEPQIIEQPDGSDGLVLLCYRHDDRVELYAGPTLEVDPAGYDGLGQGLTGVHRTPMEPARFEVTSEGLQVDLAFSASNGRVIELHLHEHLRGGRDAVSALAPVGGAFTTPASFPFLWLPSLSFVPVRKTDVSVRIDGEPRTIARLPIPVGGRRCLMARYDPDVMVCHVNPERVRDGSRASAGGAARSGAVPSVVEIAEVHGRSGVDGVMIRRGERTCGLRLDPPLPDLQDLPAGTRGQGVVTLQADGVTELRGRYAFNRHHDRAEIVIDRIGPWRTRQRRPLFAILFRLPVFRRWPTTYRWHATLEFTDEPTVSSRWTRQAKQRP
jgi:hypothetical protein